MNDPSSMFNQMKLEISGGAISSPASEGGNSRFDLQDGPKICPCGTSGTTARLRQRDHPASRGGLDKGGDGGNGDMLSESELSAMEKRCEAATPGPWHTVDLPWRDHDGPTYVIAGHFDPHLGQPVLDGIHIDEWEGDEHPGYDQSDADLTFAAHARQDLPACIAEIRRLKKERNLLRNALGRLWKCSWGGSVDRPGRRCFCDAGIDVLRSAHADWCNQADEALRLTKDEVPEVVA